MPRHRSYADGQPSKDFCCTLSTDDAAWLLKRTGANSIGKAVRILIAISRKRDPSKTLNLNT